MSPASSPNPSTSTPPKPSLSLNRQQVLDEDEYTAALSDIIARDFFPSLVHLDATNTYLDALQSEDTQRINASVRRLHDLATPQASSSSRARYPLQTPGRTPYGAGPIDTPLRTPRSEGSNKRPRFDTSLSLDTFQAKYTSEDNSSFTEILDEENRKRKEKWGWAWEAQKRARDVKAIEMGRRDSLFIEDTTSQPPGVKQRLMVEAPDMKMITAGEASMAPGEANVNNGSPNEGVVVFKPHEETTTALVKVDVKDVGSEVDVMAPKKDTRSAAVDGWSFKTRNSLMFGPGADISPYDGPTSLPTEQPKGPPKLIKHANTRLPEQSNEDRDTASTAPSSPTRSKVGAAIAGTPYVPRGERTDLSLLPSLPSPTPSQLGPAAVNQLMTWGTLNATPRVLSSDPDAVPGSAPHAPTTPFHLPAPTSREKVAHKLSSSASRSLRAKASLLSGTPARSAPGILFGKSKRNTGDTMTPSTPRAHPGLLTPAARRLLDRTAGVRTSATRRAEVMSQESNWEGLTGKDKELGNVRWTPSPSPVTRRVT